MPAARPADLGEARILSFETKLATGDLAVFRIVAAPFERAVTSVTSLRLASRPGRWDLLGELAEAAPWHVHGERTLVAAL
jgi:hypothetical protein